jgi:uncharacterized LabA/DUF88 family protein
MQNNIDKYERVVVYVDGFNLYFGIREASYHKSRWLNVRLLAQNLLKPNQILKEVKYFTSRVSNHPEKQKRQSVYLEALQSEGVKIFYGNYQNSTILCNRCGHTWLIAKEKMTDVNIATQIIIDAYNDEFDMAMLISGDSDLVPPINSVHKNFKNKRVFIAFPPKRHNNSMAIAAKGSLIIGRKKLADSQFETEVLSLANYKLKKPESW